MVIQKIKNFVVKLNVQLVYNNRATLPRELAIIYSQPKGTRVYYDTLVMDGIVPKCCRKWNEKFNTEINWKTTFKQVQSIQEIKLKWLQIRIIHRILATNVVLLSMGVQPEDKCTFCHRERDSIEHMFWRCMYVSPFWNDFKDAVNNNCMHITNFSINEHLIIVGNDPRFKSDKIFYFIILSAKFFIYKCKIEENRPHFNVF